MKKFKIPVKFTFEGDFFVTAETKERAIEILKHDCGMSLDNGIDTNQPEDIVDWNFDCTPEKKISYSQIRILKE